MCEVRASAAPHQNLLSPSVCACVCVPVYVDRRIMEEVAEDLKKFFVV